MSDFAVTLSALGAHKNLSAAQIAHFLDAAIAGKLSEADKLKFLRLHTAKGATAAELAAAAAHLQLTKTPSHCIDICGTGGSGLPRINVSTIAAFVLAALDIPVAKHGNRAVTGKCGSFDLLEALGINIDIDAARSTAVFEQCGLGFFFAPRCYPQMAAFGAARKALGQPSFFNLLGPLLSPLNPEFQLIGTTTEANAVLLRDACKLLGRRRATIVVGAGGLDEASTTGVNQLFLADKKGTRQTLTADGAGLPTATVEQISGGDCATNLRIAESILRGEQPTSPQSDLVCLNVALALQLAGAASSAFHGVAQARGALTSGAAWAKLEEYRELVA